MKRYCVSIIVCIAVFLLSSPVSQAAPIDDPFGYFHVYSLGDINYATSDFEGTTGAGQNVTVSDFTFYNYDANEYFLHAGGAVSITRGTQTGAVEGAGDMTLNNIYIKRDDALKANVYSGGSISGNGGSIFGNAYAKNGYTLPLSTIKAPGTGAYTGQAYSPAADLGAISSFFSNFSTTVAGWGDTSSGSITNQNSGAWTIAAVTGVNVFSITAAELLNAYDFNVTGASDATVYINVTGGGAQSLDSTIWTYQGVSASNVLLNYTDAVSLSMTSSNAVNILAPGTDVEFYGGVNTGNLIVGNLSGSGQVNLGHFNGPELPSNNVPEPGTILLLSTGLVVGVRSGVRKK